MPGRIAQPAIRLAGGDGQSGIHHYHPGAVFKTPVVDHAEMHRPGLRLVVADVDVKGSAAQITRRITVAAAADSRRGLEGDPLGFRAERLGIGEIGRAPELGEQPDVSSLRVRVPVRVPAKIARDSGPCFTRGCLSRRAAISSSAWSQPIGSKYCPHHACRCASCGLGEPAVAVVKLEQELGLGADLVPATGDPPRCR